MAFITSGSSVTGEIIEDNIAALLVAGTGITIVYDDPNDTLTISVSPSGIDHGGLAGLGDDDHTQYALLAGRAGGQTLIGGTAASNNLTLQSTSHATRGVILCNDPLQVDLIKDPVGLLSVDVGDRELRDSSGVAACLWEFRQFYDSSARTVVDWEYRVLQASNLVATVDWGSNILQDLAAELSLDWENRAMFDSVGGGSIDYNARWLINSFSGPTLDWENQQLLTSGSGNCATWGLEADDTSFSIQLNGGTSAGRVLCTDSQSIIMATNIDTADFENGMAKVGSIPYELYSASEIQAAIPDDGWTWELFAYTVANSLFITDGDYIDIHASVESDYISNTPTLTINCVELATSISLSETFNMWGWMRITRITDAIAQVEGMMEAGNSGSSRSVTSVFVANDFTTGSLTLEVLGIAPTGETLAGRKMLVRYYPAAYVP